MNIAWVVIALGIAIAVAARFAMWRRGDQPPDLGSVSNHWVAEHRYGSSQDSRR